MGTESITLGPPTNADTNDGASTFYTLGAHFSVDPAADTPMWTGADWLVPTTLGSSLPNPYSMGLWSNGGGAILTPATTITPLPGGTLQRFTADTPFALTPGDEYLVGVLTHHYSYKSGQSYPMVSTPDGAMSILNHCFLETSTLQLPSGNTALNFMIAPVITVGSDPEEHSGTAGVGIGLAPSGSGRKAGRGLAANGLSLAPAGTGRKVGRGNGAVTISLALSASGTRHASGTAAVTLRLAPAATGSNPDSAIVPGTLRVRDSAASLVVRDSPTGLRIREA